MYILIHVGMKESVWDICDCKGLPSFSSIADVRIIDSRDTVRELVSVLLLYSFWERPYPHPLAFKGLETHTFPAKDYIEYVEKGLIPNCSQNDILRDKDILGPYLASLKGETRQKTQTG